MLHDNHDLDIRQDKQNSMKSLMGDYFQVEKSLILNEYNPNSIYDQMLLSQDKELIQFFRSNKQRNSPFKDSNSTKISMRLEIEKKKLETLNFDQYPLEI